MMAGKNTTQEKDIIKRIDSIIISEDSSKTIEEYKKIVLEHSKKRIASGIKNESNNSLLRDALAVSEKYDNHAKESMQKLSIVTRINKAINPFFKPKPVVNYIEFQASMSEQIISIDKRIKNAIAESNYDIAELIEIKDRLTIVYNKIGNDIDLLKELFSSTTIEISLVNDLIADCQNNNRDEEEIYVATNRLNLLNASLTRLDRLLMGKQSEYSNIIITVQGIEDDIDSMIDQAESLKITQGGLIRLIDSASISDASDRTLDRAKFNSRVQTGINKTLISYAEKKLAMADDISRQNERPIHGVSMIEKISEIQSQVIEIKTKNASIAAQERIEIRKKLSNIVEKAIISPSMMGEKSDIVNRMKIGSGNEVKKEIEFRGDIYENEDEDNEDTPIIKKTNVKQKRKSVSKAKQKRNPVSK